MKVITPEQFRKLDSDKANPIIEDATKDIDIHIMKMLLTQCLQDVHKEAPEEKGKSCSQLQYCYLGMKHRGNKAASMSHELLA
jgi:hypothetical protein